MAERMAGQELLVDAVAEAERETSGVCGAAPDSQCFSQTELKCEATSDGEDCEVQDALSGCARVVIKPQRSSGAMKTGATMAWRQQ